MASNQGGSGEQREQLSGENRFCTECGARLSKGNRFCTNCGTPVPPDLQAEEPDGSPAIGNASDTAPRELDVEGTDPQIADAEKAPSQTAPVEGAGDAAIQEPGAEDAAEDVAIAEGAEAKEPGTGSAAPQMTVADIARQGSTEAREAGSESAPKTSKLATAFKKKPVIIGSCVAAVLVILAILFGTHVICLHNWQDATCTEPRTCSICKRMEGYALGHDLTEATCTEAETCKRCVETFGDPLGHDAPDVTCTESGICTRCGAEVPATGHSWTEATCTEPKTCSTCGATEGEALGHTTSSGICTRCGNEVFETETGSGDDVREVTVGSSSGSGIYRLHFTNSGRSNFAVWSTRDGDKDLLINTIGSYDGYVLLGTSGTYTLEIESSGSWGYTVEKLQKESETSLSGKGDYVTGMIGGSGGTWRFTHDGSSNFAIWGYTSSGRDLLVNTIGNYDGKKMVDVPTGGYVFFEINADGNWTAAKE